MLKICYAERSSFRHSSKSRTSSKGFGEIQADQREMEIFQTFRFFSILNKIIPNKKRANTASTDIHLPHCAYRDPPAIFLSKYNFDVASQNMHLYSTPCILYMHSLLTPTRPHSNQIFHGMGTLQSF